MQEQGFIWNILFLQAMAGNADSNVLVLTSTITHRCLSVCERENTAVADAALTAYQI